MKAFRARLGDAGERPLVELPFDAKEAFGKARAPVRGRVNGTEFRTTVAVYGGRFYVGFKTELRRAAGVELPPELAEAREEFERLSYTHKREYAEWITGAKREDTRRRRAVKAVEMLRAGMKHP